MLTHVTALAALTDHGTTFTGSGAFTVTPLAGLAGLPSL